MKIVESKSGKRKRSKKSKNKKHQGGNIINKLIDRLPIEIHIPSYPFCGTLYCILF